MPDLKYFYCLSYDGSPLLFVIVDNLNSQTKIHSQSCFYERMKELKDVAFEIGATVELEDDRMQGVISLTISKSSEWDTIWSQVEEHIQSLIREWKRTASLIAVT